MAVPGVFFRLLGIAGALPRFPDLFGGNPPPLALIIRGDFVIIHSASQNFVAVSADHFNLHRVLTGSS